MGDFNLYHLDKSKNIHFIGIGGVSMSALAVILKNDGFSVSGSDFKESEATKDLIKKGIDVRIGHLPENLVNVCCVVYTAAIKEDNLELSYARTLGVPVMDRAAMLGEIMKNYKFPICISGTHGKTTTTSMLTNIFLKADKDPSVLVGGNLSSIGGNMRDGGKDYLITEACEYCRSFLKFYPFMEIILNVEEDHLDCFKDIDDIKECFRSFTENPPKDGYIIANYDDANTIDVVKDAKCKVVSYAVENEDADYLAKNITYAGGCGEFDVYYKNEKMMKVSFSVTGEHNVSNALSCVAAAKALGIENDDICDGIFSFTGTARRFEIRGKVNGAPVIDDYAHHPTEIKATLKAAKNYTNGKIYGIFQPHTYTRAYKLLSEFSESFYMADEIIVTDIYAAREKDTGLITSEKVTEEINKKSKNAVYVKEFSDICDYLRKNVKEGDLVITLGAGNVNDICKMLTE